MAHIISAPTTTDLEGKLVTVINDLLVMLEEKGEYQCCLFEIEDILIDNDISFE